jgi:hypothetical protein
MAGGGLTHNLSVPTHLRAEQIGHVVVAVRYRAGRRAICSCGAEVTGESDEMAEAYRIHR